MGLVEPLAGHPTEGHGRDKSEAGGQTQSAANDEQQHGEHGNRTPDLQPQRREIPDVAVVLQALRGDQYPSLGQVAEPEVDRVLQQRPAGEAGNETRNERGPWISSGRLDLAS
jgi:hypothetical protein